MIRRTIRRCVALLVAFAMLGGAVGVCATAVAAEPSTNGDSSPTSNGATVQVTDEQGLRNAIPQRGGVTIELTADITLTSTLEIPEGVSVSLIGGASANDSANDKDSGFVIRPNGAISSWTRANANLQDSHANMVHVAEGASLTLGDGAVLAGPRNGAGENMELGGRVLVNEGAFTMNGGIIRDFVVGPANDYAIVTDGDKATFTVAGGRITGNTADINSGALIGLGHGAKMTMSGGSIDNNLAESSRNPSETMNDVIIDVTHALAKEINQEHYGQSSDEQPSSFTFTGGAVKDNAADSTIRVGDRGAALRPDYASYETTYTAGPATMTMSGEATIEGNTAFYAGGGVLVWGPGSFTMNGGSIKGNTSNSGGGVAAIDTYTVGDMGSADRQTRTGTIADWSRYNPAAFTMNGGTISGNETSIGSTPVGGGVYVASDGVNLKAGTITGNKSSSQGGGVYVASLPYTLYLSDVLVTGNTAAKLGGGMWLCPSGAARNSLRNGGAIIGNTAKGDGDSAGDDVVSLSKNREGGDTGARLSLLNRMLGNWVVDWYRDSAVSQQAGLLGDADATTPRYKDQKESERVRMGGVIKNYDQDVALKAIASDKGVEAARKAAKLLISGNTSVRGGGIGSNGNVQFGEKPVDYPTIDVKATKVWTDKGDHPVSVTVKLFQQVGDGEKVQIDEVELNESNQWSHTWTDLQVYEGDGAKADGKHKVTYSVEEVPVEGYTSKPTFTTDDKGNVSYTITNTKDEKTPPPTPPTPPTPTPPTTEITGVKRLTGRDLKAGEFEFELSPKSPADAPMPARTTVANTADGSFAFGPITFAKAGTYVYEVREKAGTSEGVTYDRSVFTVTIVVGKVGGGDSLEVTSYVVTDDKGGAVVRPEFVNSYDKPKHPGETPPTPEQPEQPGTPVTPNKPSTPERPHDTIARTGAVVGSVVLVAMGLAVTGCAMLALRGNGGRNRDGRNPR